MASSYVPNLEELAAGIIYEEVLKTRKALLSNILDHTILVAKFPLDYGKHPTDPRSGTEGLGSFDKLSLELQHNILSKVDINTFMDFRCVNQKALAVTDGIPQFKKIMSNETTANTIRVAIGLQCAHRVVIEDLFKKLCQKNCDDCGKPAPYIDIFNIARRCIDVGGICKPRHVPLRKSTLMATYNLTESQVMGLPSFFCFAGQYGIWDEMTFSCHGTLFDREAASVLNPDISAEDIEFQAHSKCSITFVDFLKERDMGTESVMFCPFCKEKVLSRPQIRIEPDMFQVRARQGYAALFPWTPMPPLPPLPPKNPCAATLCISEAEDLLKHMTECAH